MYYFKKGLTVNSISSNIKNIKFEQIFIFFFLSPMIITMEWISWKWNNIFTYSLLNLNHHALHHIPTFTCNFPPLSFSPPLHHLHLPHPLLHAQSYLSPEKLLLWYCWCCYYKANAIYRWTQGIVFKMKVGNGWRRKRMEIIIRISLILSRLMREWGRKKETSSYIEDYVS